MYFRRFSGRLALPPFSASYRAQEAQFSNLPVQLLVYLDRSPNSESILANDELVTGDFVVACTTQLTRLILYFDWTAVAGTDCYAVWAGPATAELPVDSLIAAQASNLSFQPHHIRIIAEFSKSVHH